MKNIFRSTVLLFLAFAGIFLPGMARSSQGNCTTGLQKSATFRSSIVDFLIIDLFSDIVPREDVLRAVDAVKAQVEKDFAPLWGVSARIKVLPRGKIPTVKNNTTVLVYLSDTLQNSSEFGGIANHYIVLEEPDAFDGHQPQFWIPEVPLVPFGTPVVILPYGDGTYGISVGIDNPIIGLSDAANILSVALSHETLETLADPFAGFNFLGAYQILTPGPKKTLAYFREVCDPVEFNSAITTNFYKRKDRLVANFVTPDYFNVEASSDTCLDFLGNVQKPLTPFGGAQNGYEIKKNGEFNQLIYLSFPDKPKKVIIISNPIYSPKGSHAFEESSLKGFKKGFGSSLWISQ